MLLAGGQLPCAYDFLSVWNGAIGCLMLEYADLRSAVVACRLCWKRAE
jgi:hypothetical protein